MSLAILSASASPQDNTDGHQKTKIENSTTEELEDDDVSKLFIRDSEVLLKPKEFSFSMGFSYTKNDYSQNLRKVRERRFSIPLQINYGAHERMEIFGYVPLIYTESEFLSFGESVKEESSGVGDLSFGASYDFLLESQNSVSLTTNLTIIAPLNDGQSPDDYNAVALDNGFWGVKTGLTITKTVDPAVFFIGFDYGHLFAEKRSGVTVQPGDSFGYEFGLGFSINNQVAIHGRFSGNYYQEISIDGKGRPGSSFEPISFSVGTFYKTSEKRTIESTINFGLNDEAEDISININFIFGS